MVSTPLKNISQNGNLPQIGVKINNLWNHQQDDVVSLYQTVFGTLLCFVDAIGDSKLYLAQWLGIPGNDARKVNFQYCHPITYNTCWSWQRREVPQRPLFFSVFHVHSLKLTWHLKIGHAKRKRLYSNHPFSGANLLLVSVSGSLLIQHIYAWKFKTRWGSGLLHGHKRSLRLKVVTPVTRVTCLTGATNKPWFHRVFPDGYCEKLGTITRMNIYAVDGSFEIR